MLWMCLDTVNIVDNLLVHNLIILIYIYIHLYYINVFYLYIFVIILVEGDCWNNYTGTLYR
jgi:hypothetical protein